MIEIGSIVAVLPRNGELAVVTGIDGATATVEALDDGVFFGEYPADDLEEVR